MNGGDSLAIGAKESVKLPAVDRIFTVEEGKGIVANFAPHVMPEQSRTAREHGSLFPSRERDCSGPVQSPAPIADIFSQLWMGFGSSGRTQTMVFRLPIRSDMKINY